MTLLFHSAPDLLDEFKQFLPDTTGEQTAVQMGQQDKPARGVKRPAVKKDAMDTGSAKKVKSIARPKTVEEKAKVSSRGILIRHETDS